MNRPSNFQNLWSMYQQNRPRARNMFSGNRCAFVLSMTLGDSYAPKQDSAVACFQDTSLRDIRRKPERIRGERLQAKEDTYYINASQLANRLRAEWGVPDLTMNGLRAVEHLRHSTGVLLIKHSGVWPELSRTTGITFGDHIDLRNGSVMGAFSDKDKCRHIIEFALRVSLWKIR